MSKPNLEDLINMIKKDDGQMKPTALDIQKRKFLAALSKTKLCLTKEEDELRKAFAEDFRFDYLYRSHPAHWTDAVGTEEVKKIITKNQNFDIALYLNCAKLIFLAYSGKTQNNHNINKAYTYVLTHARTFGDPAKNMFQLEVEGVTTFTIQFNDAEINRPLSDSVYMRKITNLINDLRMSFDETKYRILNVNVTYLTLLILRRSARSETQFKDSFNHAKIHNDYVELCPHPLQEQLPKVSDVFNSTMSQSAIRPTVILAIHAFLSGTDVLTKKTLQTTCVQYIEWTGLQLPSLFFKVVELYKIEEGELWDSLRRVRCSEKPLYRLSEVFYEQFKRSLLEPPETAAWFPYCRVLNGIFHSDLCAADNRSTCLILTYLVDLKLGFNKSFARNAHWTQKTNQMQKASFLKIATQLSEEHPFA